MDILAIRLFIDHDVFNHSGSLNLEGRRGRKISLPRAVAVALFLIGRSLKRGAIISDEKNNFLLYKYPSQVSKMSPLLKVIHLTKEEPRSLYSFYRKNLHMIKK